MAGTFMTILNDSTFSPVTGVQTPEPLHVPGPLAPTATSIMGILPSSLSVMVTPIPS